MYSRLVIQKIQIEVSGSGSVKYFSKPVGRTDQQLLYSARKGRASIQRTSNKDRVFSQSGHFFKLCSHASLITRRFENIDVSQFSLEFSIEKKICAHGERPRERKEKRVFVVKECRGSRHAVIDVKMINDGWLINIILNSVPVGDCHPPTSSKNNDETIVKSSSGKIINFFHSASRYLQQALKFFCVESSGAGEDQFFACCSENIFIFSERIVF